jgi:hypothetical protein
MSAGRGISKEHLAPLLSLAVQRTSEQHPAPVRVMAIQVSAVAAAAAAVMVVVVVVVVHDGRCRLWARSCTVQSRKML